MARRNTSRQASPRTVRLMCRAPGRGRAVERTFGRVVWCVLPACGTTSWEVGLLASSARRS
eukprot:6308525-Prymnesium_polylepis.1